MPIPIIESAKVGVKLPDSGVGGAVGVAEEVEIGVGVALGVADGLAVGEDFGVAEGVDSKAGPSAAWTIKLLVKVLKIPPASFHVIVIVCMPGSRLVGGLKFQSPFEGTLTEVVIGSDSTVIVRVTPGGPSPKNAGFVVVTISPSSKLSKVTVEAEGVAVFSGTVKPDDGVEISGSPIEALGISLEEEGGRLLKSWTCPKIIEGTGLADWG